MVSGENGAQWVVQGRTSLGTSALCLLAVVGACTFSGNGSPTPVDAGPTPLADAAVDAAASPDAAIEDPFKSCRAHPTEDPPTKTVSPAGDLAAVITTASEGDIVEFSGTHDIDLTIVMSTDDVTVRGVSSGGAAINLAAGIVGIDVVASRVTLANFELTGGGRQVVVSGNGAVDTSGFLANSMTFTRAGLTGFEARDYSAHHPSPLTGVADAGVVACSVFESPISNCNSVRGAVLDAGNDWRFTKNQFLNYDCSTTSFAMHVHSTENPLVDRNLFSGYYVGLRLGSFAADAVHGCAGSGMGTVVGGVVCSNVFLGSDQIALIAVDIVEACEASAAHNTVYSIGGGNAFRASRPSTVLTVANNVSNIGTLSSGGLISGEFLATNQFNAAGSESTLRSRIQAVEISSRWLGPLSKV